MSDAVGLPGLPQALDGRYRLERELGRGGMGVVYLARELNLDRAVALKVLPPELGALPELRERFLREARTAALLSHPNIVPIHHAAEAGGFAFFAMGFVDGENLAEHLRARGRLSPQETVRVLREIAWALAYAHARGVVHRDVKPENVMLERGTGRVLVTDFGIARDERVTSLTEQGRVLGTVWYMSPEQATGEPLDGRSDLYALGVVGFLALTGRLPFTSDAPGAVLVMHATKAAPKVRDVAPDVPEALARVIDRCLAKAPADRFATGEALADALTATLEADRTPAAGVPAARVLSPEEAQAVWLRAAQLQQDAASRIRDRTRELEAAGMATASYRLQDVVAAANEVGIANEFVQLALTELPSKNVPPAPPSDRTERLTTTLLGTRDRSLRVTLVVPSTPARVLEALGRVVTGPPYGLQLVDTSGGHPLDGGVMNFHRDLDATGLIAASGVVNMFTYRLKQLELADLRMTLRPLGADRGTEVAVYGDLRPGMRKNVLVSHGVAGSLAGGGAVIATVAVLKSLALGLSGAMPVALPVALPVAGAAAALGYGLYRHSYRAALQGAEKEIRAMLQAVAGSLRAVEVFGAPPPPPVSPPKAMGDGGLGPFLVS